MGRASERVGYEDKESFPTGPRRRFSEAGDVEDLWAAGGEGFPRLVVVGAGEAT